MQSLVETIAVLYFLSISSFLLYRDRVQISSAIKRINTLEGRLTIVITTTLIFLFIFFYKSNFERFAYEMCNLEGKYTKRICSCKANNLDDILSNNEKEAFREIVAGGIPSFDLITSISDKSEKVIKDCVF